VRLGFDILRYESDPNLYIKGEQNFAVLLEGRQLSIFENRITPEFEQQMRSLDQEFKSVGEESKVIVIADGDVAKNIYNPTSGEIAETGYNKFENYVFTGNQDLFFNSVEYMLDDNGVIEARSKEVTLRMLDTVKASNEKSKWQLLNVVLPLAVVFLGAWLFNFVRRKRFAV
jgi:ABC-2 type transport system permease protein